MENILQLLKLTKQKYEKLAEVNGERFNVFSIIELETDEVRTHSKFIAELLNPKGSHSQRTLFLKSFLDTLSISYIEEELQDFKVEVEKATVKYGRVDILLRKKNRVIIIENKIYAGDQEEQLGRYYRYAKSLVKDETQIEVLYLTLDGAEPEEYTLGDKISKEDVRCVSYEADIISWFDECIRQTARVPQIREVLHQYQQLLRKLTGKTTNKNFIMEAKDIFYKEGNYQMIQDLEHAIDAFKVDVQYTFWEELRVALINKKVAADNELDSVERTAVENYYYRYGSGKYYYGLSFDIIPIDKDYSVGFKVEIYNAIYYGFRVSKMGEGHGPECKDKRFAEYVNKIQSIPSIGQEFKNTQWWLGYRYSKKDFDFVHFNNEVIYGLMKEESRKQLVDELAEEIAQGVEGLRKELA